MGLATGMGVFPHVATPPAFLLVAAVAFALAFYKVAH